MRILGIDPGLERVGFGLIERDSEGRYIALDWGIISTSKHDSEACRLDGIYGAMKELLAQTKPDMAAIEKLFFFRNVSTMGPVSQARGILLLTLYQAGVSYLEYTPMQVKMNTTGYGKSTKTDIQVMIQQIFGLDDIPKPDDAADALAIALSCAFEQGPINLLMAKRQAPV